MQNIGCWQTAMEVMGVIGVIVNCALIGQSSPVGLVCPPSSASSPQACLGQSTGSSPTWRGPRPSSSSSAWSTWCSCSSSSSPPPSPTCRSTWRRSWPRWSTRGGRWSGWSVTRDWRSSRWEETCQVSGVRCEVTWNFLELRPDGQQGLPLAPRHRHWQGDSVWHNEVTSTIEHVLRSWYLYSSACPPLLSSIVHRHLIYLFQTPRASEGCSEDILHFYFKVVTQTQLLKCYNHWFSWMSWGNPWKLTEFRSTSTRARNLQFIVCNVLLPFCLPQSNGILCILLHSYWWFMFL